MLYCSLPALQTGQAGPGVRRFVKWGAIQYRGQRHVPLISEGYLSYQTSVLLAPTNLSLYLHRCVLGYRCSKCGEHYQ